MTRLTQTLLLIAVFALAAPSAFAKGKGPKSPSAPDPAAADASKQSIDKLCAEKDNPLPDLKPAEPKDLGGVVLEDDKPMKDEDVAKLKFNPKYCVQSQAAGVTGCDLTYATTFRSVRDGRIILKKALGDICDEVKDVGTKCAGQTDSQKCANDIYKGVGDKLKKTVAVFDQAITDLGKQKDGHVSAARTELPEIKPKNPAAAANDPGNPKVILAKAAGPAPATRTTDATITGCTSKTLPSPTRPFCDHIGAATDSGFFAEKLKLVVQQKKEQIAGLDKLSSVTGDNTKNGGSADAKSGSGMDMNDMLKLATLGMTGAAMYCQITKKCGNSSDPSQSSLTDPNAKEGATSPTPTSTNPDAAGSKTETSSLGNNPTGGSATNSPTGTAPQAATTSANYHGGSGGFSGESTPHYGVGSGDGAGRGLAAASSGPVGGGGSTGASMGGGLLSSGTAGADANAKTPGSGDGGGGGGMMGGASMGGASGGFNLGDGKSSTPADSALKNILNGDTPPADAALDPLAGSAGATAGADGGVEDAESLFTRVKETHVRCLKRGCVGREVGTNI